MTDERGPDAMTDDEMAKIAAEELNIEEENIELPPNVRRGITLFELENGDFGFIPTTEDTTLMDALVLAMRVQAGIQADLTAQKVMEYEDKKLAELRTEAAAAQKKARTGIISPGRGRRGR